MKKPHSSILLLSAVCAVGLICSGCREDTGKAIAKEAYVFGFPMVMNYKTICVYF